MSNNNILFIGTSFFNIEKKIISAFEKNGFSVDYYNDRPSNNSLVKGLIKINKKLSNPLNKRYFFGIINKTKNKSYNKVFILNGKIIDETMLLKLKKAHPESEFIFYTYDTLKLYTSTIEILHHFDRAYSFDTKDVEVHSKIELLPLFFNKEIESIESASEYRYDLLSVCTAHPNRYEIIKELFPKLKTKDVKIYSFLYLNKLQYIYNKLFVSQFKQSKKSEFNFKPLSMEEHVSLISKTKMIFDVEHSKQTGLTMRTIETLGAKRKLMTTNREVKKYNFYSEENILVFSKETTVDEIQEFILKPFKLIDQDIYNQYSIDTWIKTILGIIPLGEYLDD